MSSSLDSNATEQSIDIETSGNAVSLLLAGRTVVSFDIDGDAAASYQIDARKDGGTWKNDVGPKTYSGSSNYDDVLETGAEEIRIRCSSGTGTPGDSADMLISAGGR